MPSAFLQNQSHFKIEGADAEDFLQNLITTDLDHLEAGYAAPGALLTPQGKILFFFMINRTQTGFSLETGGETAGALTKRLSIYKLRAKVEISEPENSGTSVWWDEDGASGAVKDIRFEKAGRSLYRKPGAGAEGDGEAYDALRAALVIPEPGKDFALGDAFPHDVMLDLTNGVSFKKGCYVGQEVVSRMHHRSTARRRPVQVISDGPLPDSGSTIAAGEKAIGELGTAAGNLGLAIVRIDRAGTAMAAGTPLLAGDKAVELTLAPWSGLSFPQNDEGE